jgi:hypothetical protein
MQISVKALVENQFSQILKEGTIQPYQNPSSLVMGVHKGGSTMLHSFIRSYSNQLKRRGESICALNLPHLLFQGGYADDDFDDAGIIPRLISESKHVCAYGWRQVPLSFLRHKKKLQRMPSVCLIRDPRDCVVSAYFSFLKTHRLPQDLASSAAQKVLLEREKGKDMSIDRYCQENYPRFTQELLRIAAFLNPMAKIYRYEDAWENKEWFFKDALDHIDLPYEQGAFNKAFASVDIKPGEDPRGHVRKGTPGDHKQKLKDETIKRITELSSPLLDFFGYETS